MLRMQEGSCESSCEGLLGTLVLIEAVPLCCLDPHQAASLAAMLAQDSLQPRFPACLPARCAALMSCSEACALVGGDGYVFF